MFKGDERETGMKQTHTNQGEGEKGRGEGDMEGEGRTRREKVIFGQFNEQSAFFEVYRVYFSRDSQYTLNLFRFALHT